MAMNTNLAGMSPILGMGGNFGGSQQSVPTAASMSTPAIGGSGNPFLPAFPGGQTMPTYTSPYSASGSSYNGSPASMTIPNFSANGPGAGGSGLAGMNVSQMLGGLTNPYSNESPQQGANNFVKSMRKAGYSDAVAGALWNFLQSGAGYNPQVASTLIGNQLSFMQPQIARGEADIMEKFGAQGLGSSSAAAIGLGDYLSQVNLNEEQVTGQILSGLYEQSVQNYMQVLMGGKGNPPKSTFDNILGFLSAAGQGAQGAGAIMAA